MNYPIHSIGVVILAAGQSSRLGKPKQLLTLNGLTLLEKAASAALDLNSSPVLVVLGAYADDIKSNVQLQGVDIAVNEGWEEGMASSLRMGIEYMQQNHVNVDAILFLVCDQPYLHSALLKDLIALQKEKDLPIAASSYGGKIGTPALFHQSTFSSLMLLKGDTGARKLLDERMNDVAVLHFEKGVYDIDTVEDYEQLLHGK
jgi:molybdenum cofactor cytidylyltransferase